MLSLIFFKVVIFCLPFTHYKNQKFKIWWCATEVFCFQLITFFHKNAIKMFDWVLNALLTETEAATGGVYRTSLCDCLILVRILVLLYKTLLFLVKTLLFFEKDKVCVGYVELLYPSVSRISFQLLASCPKVSIIYVCFSNDVMEIC